MAKDAITMFKEAAAQLQKEIEYVALDSARKMNDEDETLQELIGDFNLARIDLNSELSKTSGRDDEKVAALNDKVNRLYNDIMMNDSMQAYNDAKTDFDAVIQYVNAIINTAVNGGDPMTVEQPAAGKMAFRATVRDGLCPAILNFEQDGAKHGGALPNDAAIF